MTISVHEPSSFNHKYAQIGEYNYHYVEEGDPNGPPLLLVHGFPDLWYGWRHQIRHLAAKGFRVIAIDCLGYGETSAPEKLSAYSFRSIAGQLRDLLDVLDIPKVTLVGHDWGAALCYRMANWHPERVLAIISVSVSYLPFDDYLAPWEMLMEFIPELCYQLIYRDPDFVPLADFAPREFLDGLYEGTSMTEQELDYMTEQFKKTGFRGPLNYYKTRQLNFEEDKDFPRRKELVETPVFAYMGTNDPVLKPIMAQGMPYQFKTVTIEELPFGHFMMVEKPQEFNEALDKALTTFHPAQYTL